MLESMGLVPGGFAKVALRSQLASQREHRSLVIRLIATCKEPRLHTYPLDFACFCVYPLVYVAILRVFLSIVKWSH
jgi:hypothetical protein